MQRFQLKLLTLKLMDLPCFLSDYFDYQCGNFRGKSDCVNILECSDDVSTHLSRCHLSREELCEYELILLRCGMFDISTTTYENLPQPSV